MLRKDVRFGLTIGGVLVAVLVVYVLVLTRGTDKIKTSDVTLVTNGGGDTPPANAAKPNQPTGSPGVTLVETGSASASGNATATPTGATAGAPAPAGTPSVSAAAAPAAGDSTASAAPADSAGKDKWATLLATGMLDASSPTPAGNAAPGSDNSATAINFTPSPSNAADTAEPAPAAPSPASPSSASPAPKSAAPAADTGAAKPAGNAGDTTAGNETVASAAPVSPIVGPSIPAQNSAADANSSADSNSAGGADNNNPSSSTTSAADSTSAANSTAAAGQRTHKIASGETLSSISAAAYGNSRYWKQILAANPKLNPNALRPGMVIVLPPLAHSARSEAKAGSDNHSDNASDNSASSDSASDNSVSNAASISDKPADALARGSYKVQPGDNLYKIAKKLYHNGAMADAIYQLNKATIGDDPAQLKPGMTLKLPAAKQ